VHRSREGVQVAVDNSQEHLGVAGIVKEGLAYPKEAQGVRRMTRMGGQAAARKGWEAQGVRRMMRMGDQAAVRKGWEDLEVVHSCQQTDLDNHYYGDVQDSCLLILAVEIQSCGSIISISICHAQISYLPSGCRGTVRRKRW
jgi:hypothetical protein